VHARWLVPTQRRSGAHGAGHGDDASSGDHAVACGRVTVRLVPHGPHSGPLPFVRALVHAVHLDAFLVVCEDFTKTASGNRGLFDRTGPDHTTEVPGREGTQPRTQIKFCPNRPGQVRNMTLALSGAAGRPGVNASPAQFISSCNHLPHPHSESKSWLTWPSPPALWSPSPWWPASRAPLPSLPTPTVMVSPTGTSASALARCGHCHSHFASVRQ
jgi:hypothetical protein